MPLRIEPVDVYRESLVCDCGEVMRCNTMKPMQPPLFVHQCPHCGKLETKGQQYPRLVYLRKRNQHHDQDKADKRQE